MAIDLKKYELKNDLSKYKKKKTPDSPGYFKSVIDDYIRISSGIKSGISKGAEQVEQGNIVGGLARGALRTVGGVAEAAFTPILEAPGIKQGIEAVGAGISKIPGTDVLAEKLGRLAKKYPEASKDVKNIIDILALGGGRAGEKAVGRGLKKTGATLEKTGKESAKSIKENFALSLVKPVETKAVKLAEVGRTKEVGGLLKKDVVLPTKQEIASAKVVSEISGIAEKNTFQKNFNIIRDYNQAQAKLLEADIAKYDFIIPRKEIMSRLKVAAEELSNSPLIVGDAAKTAERLIKGAEDIINKNKGTGSGLLKARKEYDAWVKTQKPKIFDAASENALTLSNNTIRDTLNTLLDEKAINLGIKDSLRRQSSLFRAMENVAPKAAIEANTQFGRLMQSVGKTLGTKNKIVQGIAAAVGIGGLGAAATFAPAAAVLGTTGFLLYRGGKLLMNPKVRIHLGELLQKYGKSLSKEDRKAIESLLETYKEAKKIPGDKSGFAKIPKLTKESRGQTFLSPDEISKIQREAAAREAQLARSVKKGKGETPLTTEITKAKAEGKSFDEFVDKKTVFHGSNKEITEFNKNLIGQTTGNKGYFGEGFYFTPDKVSAGMFAENAIRKTGGKRVIGEYVLDYKNPFVINKDTDINLIKKLVETTSDYTKTGGASKADNALLYITENPTNFTKNLKNKGYDAIEVYFESPHTRWRDEIVVFDKSQIKTKSQLKQLWDKGGITDDIAKAKAEGKSFEEWVSKQETVYHGTEQKFENFDFELTGKSTGETPLFNLKGTWFVNNKTVAKGYGGITKEAVIDTSNFHIVDAKGKTLNNFRDEVWDAKKFVKENRKDGLIIKNLIDNKDFSKQDVGNHIFVLDENLIKTKSQLKQLWELTKLKK